MKLSLQKAALATLRADFVAAINCPREAASLDNSIAALRARISSPCFTEHLSIYSKSHLRRMYGSLGRINAIGLTEDPLEVAVAVSSVLGALNDLGFTMRQSKARAARIDAGLSCRPHA